MTDFFVFFYYVALQNNFVAISFSDPVTSKATIESYASQAPPDYSHYTVIESKSIKPAAGDWSHCTRGACNSLSNTMNSSQLRRMWRTIIDQDCCRRPNKNSSHHLDNQYGTDREPHKNAFLWSGRRRC